MSTTYEKCDAAVEQMAAAILCEFQTHKPLLDARVKVDFVFGYAEQDEDGNPKGDALRKNGIKALGICRKLPLKDRAMGRGDAEIALDGDWWRRANDAQKRALLDHELHHLAVRIDDRGVVRDDLRRPVLDIRKHDVDVGWFAVIAARHGAWSVECDQAKKVMDNYGQFFWPAMFATAEGGAK